MISFLIGFLLSVSSLLFAVSHSKTALSNFINAEGIIVVIVGSLAIFLMANRARVVKSVAKLTFRQVTGYGVKKPKEVRELILDITKNLEKGQRPQASGIELLDLGMSWIEAGLDEKHIDNLIHQYSSTKLALMDEATNAVIYLGKYPPALGMVGTVFGIIGIFSGLGADGAAEQIGPNLAVAMTATLYGLVIANFTVQPLGELLAQSVDSESRNLNMCAQAIRLWKARESSFYISEQMGLYERAA